MLALCCLWFAAGAAPAAEPEDTLSLTLAEAIETALRLSPAVVQAGATKTSGVTALAGGINDLLPNLSGSVSYGRDEAAPDSARNSWGANLSVSQVVFSPKAFAGIVSSALRYSYNSTSARDQQAKLIYDVTTDYLSLVKNHKLRGVAEAALARARKQLELVREKRRLGMVSQVDLLRAEVQESQARLGLLEADRGLAVAAENFKATEGLDREVVVVPAESLSAPEEYDIGDPDSLIREIERTNPGVRMAAKAKTIAGVNKAAAIGSILPSVNLYWNKGYSGSSLPSGFGEWWDQSQQSYGIRANLPLLDLKSYVLDAVDAANDKRRADASARAATLSIRATAADAVIGYRQAREQYDVSLANLELNRRLLELADEQLKLGAISMVDYLDAEASLVQAQSSYLSALSDTYIQAARITYLRGRTGE